MSTHNTIRKFIAAVAVSTAIGLTSLVGGAASADGPSLTGASAPKQNVPMLYQALVKNESMPATDRNQSSPAVLGKNTAPQQASDDRPTEEVAFYYNRIAFNYAASK